MSGGHCWHVTGGFTLANGAEGREDLLCCWCGQRWERQWTTRADPRHGPHSPSRVRVDRAGDASPEPPLVAGQ